jgi:hypothetical protein
MKKLIVLAVWLMACIATETKACSGPLQDSVKVIPHKMDGELTEWATDRFEENPDTRLLYSADHDQNFLYVAMKVKDQATQGRIVIGGMKLFVDTRGKKKEGTGIEFPIRQQGGGSFAGSHEAGVSGREQIREKMVMNMLMLKTFGFDGKDDNSQYVAQGSELDIVYNWDTEDNLCLEYKIPLEYIGGASSLKNKTLSIGWKIVAVRGGGNVAGMETTSMTATMVRQTTSSSTRNVNANIGGASSVSTAQPIAPLNRTGRQSRMSPNAMNPTTLDNEPKGQFIWTKHVMNF